MSDDTDYNDLHRDQMRAVDGEMYAGGSQFPEDADSLYAEGMAHYRRREWQRARECFLRLRSVSPDRRGVDALLSEVDLFIQLEAMQPEERRREFAVPDEEQEKPREEPKAPPPPVVKPRRRRSPWSAILVTLAVLMIAFAILYATGMLEPVLGGQRQARVQILVNQGRAALNVGDYDRAVQAFGEALALAPTNEEVQTWYAKAQRSQQLETLYVQATEAIAAKRWQEALQKLERIVAIDPTYKDAGSRIEFVKGQQTLDARFAEAKRHFDQGAWDEAIKILEPLREQAPAFRSDEVQQTLFYAYFRSGVQSLTAAEAAPELIGQAIQNFDRALGIFPSDATALEERQLADLYRQGYLAYNQKNWPQAVLVLAQIRSIRPDYLGGRVTVMLCDSYLKLGDVYYAAGNLVLALQQYRSVLAIEGCDHVDAAVKEREVYGLLYPPTPTPTSTRTPTRTPRPTPTPTHTPTATPSPPPPPTAAPAPTETLAPR